MTTINKNIVIWLFCIVGLLNACSPKPSYVYVSKGLSVQDSLNLSYLIWEHRKQASQKLNFKDKEMYNFLFAGSQLFHTNTFEVNVKDTIPFFPVLCKYTSVLILDKMVNKELVYTYIYIPQNKMIASYATRWHYRVQFGPKEVGLYKDLKEDIKSKIEKGKPFMITTVNKISNGSWSMSTKVYKNTK